MRAWRICRRRFADLSGEGARQFGGRWNSPGRAMVYAAEDAALAVLEVRFHLDLDWDALPVDYVLMVIDVPDTGIAQPPAHPSDPRLDGDAWLASGRSPALSVASFIVPESRTILINPAHPAAVKISLGPIRDFKLDARLWNAPKS